jgi:CubicO group peptidase (beta-lactamase class C family)
MGQREEFERGLRPLGNLDHQQADQDLTSRMRYYAVPGVSIAVIDQGVLIWAGAYGVHNASTAAPLTSQTRFPVASITKPIVAMATLRLVQHGVLDLDVDVNQYLTSWKLPASPHTRETPVTLRRLLSHSAGVTPYGFWGYRPSGPIPSLLQVLDGLPPANSAPVRVARLPGSRWSYSSGGYCIIQQLLSDVLRLPFPELMAELVLAPLEMRASDFMVVPSAETGAACAQGHDATGAPIAERWRAHPELASSGLWATAADLASWAIAVQRARSGATEGVLMPELVLQMLTPQSSNWGLGPAIDSTGTTARFTHGGAAIGFRSYLTAYCERGQGAVILANGERGDHLGIEIAHSLARAYGWPDYSHYLEPLE